MCTHNYFVLFCCIDKMDTKMSNDSAKKIQRSVGTSDLHSHQSRKQSEDEGYGSRPASMALSPYTSKSSLHSTTSTANIPSTILEDDKDSEAISRHVCDHKDNYSSPLEEPNHEGEPSSPSEEPEHLSSKMASLNLTEQSVHQSFQKCSLCDSQLKARKLSYQHPPLHQRVHYRRGSEATVSTKPSQSEKEPTCIMCRRNSQKTSLPPKRKISKSYIFKATPMRRWNSDIITVSLENFDVSAQFIMNGYIYRCMNTHTHTHTHTHTLHEQSMNFISLKKHHLYAWKHTPYPEEQGSILNIMINDIKCNHCHWFFTQALYDEDDPENPFRKVRVTISKGRRMPKTISAKSVLF